MDALVRMSGAPSALGLAGPAEHSQIIPIRPPSSGGGGDASSAARPAPHAPAGTAGATVYVGLPVGPPEAAPASELGPRHVVKIRIQPSPEPLSPRLVSAMQLSLGARADSRVRISVGGQLASQYSGSESSTEELADAQPPVSLFCGSPPVSLTPMASGQCSPSETLDSGTCSDLDGTPPPLPKKRAPSTVLLERGEASVAGAGAAAAGQQPAPPPPAQRHDRAGSLTSSGAEVDSSDDGESSISCDSLNSAELRLRFSEGKPLVSECTYEERRRGEQPQQPRHRYEDDCHYKFHVNEREEVARAELEATAVVLAPRSDDECFAGFKILEREAIRSAKGTVRGVKNRVRAGIATFLEHPSAKNYKAKDAGKVVVYTTTMGIVRETYYRCVLVKQILRTHMVKYEERDMYMSSELQTELRERLGSEAIEVPQLFIDGQHIGDADKVERLNETGELRLMLKPYKSLNACSTCQACGGYRLLPCPICNGSKKSVHRNHFTTEFIALKCMNCDEVGLVRCQHC